MVLKRFQTDHRKITKYKLNCDALVAHTYLKKKTFFIKKNCGITGANKHFSSVDLS